MTPGELLLLTSGLVLAVLLVLQPYLDPAPAEHHCSACGLPKKEIR